MCSCVHVSDLPLFSYEVPLLLAKATALVTVRRIDAGDGAQSCHGAAGWVVSPVEQPSL